jgi:hypothetical protein
MSDAAAGGVIVPPINDQQAMAILQEALNKGMMQGAIPPDEATRVSYANQLIAQAKLAQENGNTDANVTQILFLANVDQQPSAVPAQASTPVAAPPGVPPAAVTPQPQAAPPLLPPGAPPMQTQAPSAGSFDVTTIGDDSLARMIGTLESEQYVGNPDVQNELAQLHAEQTRRQGGTPVAQASQPQAVASPTQAPPTASPSSQASVASPPGAPPSGAIQPGVPGGSQPAQPATAPTAGPTGFPAGPALTADATGNPGAQAAQPSAEGDISQAGEAQEDGERVALESQLTLATLRAHNIDPNQVPSLSLENIQYLVANPAGPIATTTASTEIPNSDPVSDEREQLISQITGPMLKAWGQGRASLADVGNHELMLMIEHPEADVTVDQINTVRGADETLYKVTQLPKRLSQQQAPPAQLPQQSVAPIPVVAAPAPSAFAPIEQPAQPPAPVPVAVPQQQQAPRPVGASLLPVSSAQDRAMQIIANENMPIPPEISGTPPQLPNDISAVSDGELRSYHAQFHACEVRMNWVISGFDDEIGDVKKLLRNRRREVGLNLPKTQDGKKITKDEREALIEADDQVQQHITQLDEIEKTVGKLKVLRDGYHQDVSTCSRQWSMRYIEQERAPR